MKIVYEDERRCNLQNISEAKMPELKRLTNFNKKHIVLEANNPSQIKLNDRN